VTTKSFDPDHVLDQVMVDPVTIAAIRNQAIIITQDAWLDLPPELNSFIQRYARKAGALALREPLPPIEADSPTWRNAISRGASRTQLTQGIEHVRKMQVKKLCRNFGPQIGGDLGRHSAELRRQYATLAWAKALGFKLEDLVLTNEQYEHEASQLFGDIWRNLPVQPVVIHVEPSASDQDGD
jgi:hypothetical protein